MYRPDADPAAMVKSLEVLLAHIKLRVKDSQSEKQTSEAPAQ
jgi:hypothetical protein